ncbi:MAG: MerR family transcriptional regulator [Motiliproteus sp.]
MEKPAAVAATIDEVSRDVGVGKDSLRVWERRYGFPQPIRGSNGERLYPDEQLERLRSISRLLDQGYRPGKVMALSVEQLDVLSAQLATGASVEAESSDNAVIAQMIAAVRSGRVDQFSGSLEQMLDRQGARQFILETAVPLLVQTGKAWACGQLSIYMEHLITQHVRAALNTAANSIDQSVTGPKVLLTTLPGERHGMGLLMVDLLLRAEGVETLSLGVETPIDQIIEACTDLQPQALALAFSAVQKRTAVIAALKELSDKIPEPLVLLAGGEGVSKLRAIPPRIRIVKSLDTINKVVASLRRDLKDVSAVG